jgi:uncharacterized protein YdeI (YjbR/CyaY-like superfamily)
MTNEKEELPILEFKTLAAWEKWLLKNHDTSPGVWMRVYKKGSGIKSIEIKDALDGALCFGWIDGQRNSYDEVSYLQKYTQRRKKSIWSKVNRENVARLIEAGKIQAAGHAQIEAAKADGRWDDAYDSVRNMETPEDFMKELRKDKKALAFYETLNSQNRYAIGFRLQTAKKPETRERRLKQFIEMMKNGEKFH